jgi:hypothetical protein
MKKSQPPKEVTIVGHVTPSDWDTDDNMIGISVATDAEEYVVELTRTGEELFDFLDETVKVTGIVRSDRDGTQRIRVADYEVLDEMDEDSYGGNEDYTHDLDDEKGKRD